MNSRPEAIEGCLCCSQTNWYNIHSKLAAWQPRWGYVWLYQCSLASFQRVQFHLQPTCALGHPLTSLHVPFLLYTTLFTQLVTVSSACNTCTSSYSICSVRELSRMYPLDLTSWRERWLWYTSLECGVISTCSAHKLKVMHGWAPWRKWTGKLAGWVKLNGNWTYWFGEGLWFSQGGTLASQSQPNPVDALSHVRCKRSQLIWLCFSMGNVGPSCKTLHHVWARYGNANIQQSCILGRYQHF